MSSIEESTIDPRVERSRRVVARATLEELAESGYGGLTIDGVATRAGVGRSTIYRHWPSKPDLVAHALQTLHHPHAEPTEGTPRERVRLLLRHFAEVVSTPPMTDCLPALIEGAQRDAAVRDFLHSFNAARRGDLTRAVADGVRSGDFRGVDPEPASLALAGAIVYARLMTATPFPVARVDELIGSVLGETY